MANSDDAKKANVTDAEILKCVRELTKLGNEHEAAVEEAKTALGAKRAKIKWYKKNTGVPVQAILNAIAAKKTDEEIAIELRRDEYRVFGLMGMAILTPEIIAELANSAPSLNDDEQREHDEFEACERGLADGRAGVPSDAERYPPGSAAFVAYAKGHAQGQTELAEEAARSAAPAPVKRGGRRKAGAEVSPVPGTTTIN